VTALREHLPALLGASLLLAIVWSLPDLGPPLETPNPVALEHGRIVAIHDTGGDPSQPDVRVVIVDGPRAGEELDGYLQGPSGQMDLPDYAVGDEVVVSLTPEPENAFIAVSDRWRVNVLAAAVALFAAAVIVVGGWRGLRSLLALAFTLAVIVRIVIPLAIGGADPILLAVVGATGITIITLLLTEGWRPTTLAAALGTFASLALTAGLAILFSGLARFTELQGAADLVYLQTLIGVPVDVGGLIMMGLIFAALGVLDDVTIAQAATVHELHESDPRADRRTLFGRAMNVGRSHISATVNTLVLAYVGASLPLLLLLAAGRQPPLAIVSGEVVAVEIVRAIVGSIGIVAAVPLTTAIGVLLVSRVRGASAERLAMTGRSGAE
jgi:uncharacterized membrane protein